MFSLLSKLFPRSDAPKAPFVHQTLGKFAFSRGLWSNRILLGGRDTELTFGSDGEPPSEAMLQTAKSWIDGWSQQSPKIIEYIQSELRNWSDEPALLAAEKFEVTSINILWPDKPTTIMIYFHYPGDDFREWHATYHGFEPNGFAYDD